MDEGQKTPRGDLDFNSYMKNLRVLVFRTDGRTDGQTDRQTERQTGREINLVYVGFSHYVPPGKGKHNLKRVHFW